MNDEISLIKYWDGDNEINITIKKYYEMIRDKNKKAISKMIYHRLYDRYIKPFDFNNKVYKKKYKNGFAMMASGCLLIETLESFYNGWNTTIERGEKLFNQFFHKSNNLRKFENINFYRHIRCGILHQAETTGGFLIIRKGDLFNKKQKTINAYLFINELNSSIEDYSNKLIEAKWDEEIWDNFRRKMRFIIKNCE